MKTKLLKKVLVAILLSYQVISSLVSFPVANASTNAPQALTVALEAPQEAVLGMPTKLKVRLHESNGNASIKEDWDYNVGIRLTLPDGLSIANNQTIGSPTSIAVSSSTDRSQMVYWNDLKDMSPGEDYEFEINLYVLEDKRYQLNPTEPVHMGFGALSSGIQIEVYSSNDARQVKGPSNSFPKASATVNSPQIVPFTMEFLDLEKEVKGAGVSFNGDALGVGEKNGSEWGAFAYKIKFTNNTLYPTTFNSFVSNLDTDLDAFGFSLQSGSTLGEAENAVSTPIARTVSPVAGAVHPINLLNVELAKSKITLMTIDAAFFNKAMNGSVNSGATIEHGHAENNSVSYSASLIGNPYTVSKTVPFEKIEHARDIAIYKSANKDYVSYGSEVEYTLTVKTNEYYDIGDVVVKDVIGDGQTFKEEDADISLHASPSLGTLPATFESVTDSAYKIANGKTEIIWNLGKLPKSQIVTIKYKTTIDQKWAHDHNQGWIYAGDRLDNTATVTGLSSWGGERDEELVSDSDSEYVDITTPQIREKIVEINGSSTGVDPKKQQVTAGDVVTFEVNYNNGVEVDDDDNPKNNGVGPVNAKQHHVVIFDYLPLGTQLLDSDGNPADGDLVESVPSQSDLTAYNFTINGGTAITPKYDKKDNLLVWDFGSMDIAANGSGPSAVAPVRINALALNNSDVQKTKGDKNLVSLSFANSDSIVKSKRDEVEISYVEPEVTIERYIQPAGNPTRTLVRVDDDALEVMGGQSVKVTVKFNNRGTTPAYNLVHEETIPAELTNITNLPAGASIAVSTLTYKPSGSIARGGSLELTYDAVVLSNIGSGKTISQNSSWAYDSQATNGRHYMHPIGQSTTIDPIENSHITMKTKLPTITKDVVKIGSGTGGTVNSAPNPYVLSDKSNAHVGDWVVYKVEVTVPSGDVTYAPVLVNTIDENQELIEVRSGYVDESNQGTLVTNDKYIYVPGTGGLGGTVTFNTTKPPLHQTAGTPYIYFFKTKIATITGTQQTLSQPAKFTWMDKASGGDSYGPITDSDAVTVKAPQLKATIQTSKTVFGKEDTVPAVVTLTVTNIGKNTAYDFIPEVTIPDGYLFVRETTSPTRGAITNDITHKISFPSPVPQLAVNGTITLQFEVKLNQVQGSGASFEVVGSTGNYYTTAESYLNDYVGGPNLPSAYQKLVKNTANLNFEVPKVTLVSEIIGTSNGGDANRPTLAAPKTDNVWIRPGDVVDYRLTLTVPAGTKAFGLSIKDTIEAYGSSSQFEAVAGSLPVLSGNAPANSTATITGNVLNVDLHDFDVATATNTDITVTYRVRAISTGNSPTSGAFTVHTKEFKTTAVATWKPTAAASDFINTSDQITKIVVRQPNVTIAANSISNPVISDTNPTREVGYTLTNTQTSPAFVPIAEITVPLGLNVSAIKINDVAAGSQAVYNSTTHKVTFTNLTVAAYGSSNGVTKISFDVANTNVNGAGKTGLNFTIYAPDYRSTTTLEDASQLAKIYVLAQPGSNPSLSIAPLDLTANETSNDYGPGSTIGTVRPGDQINYQININLPGDSPAYDVILKDTGLSSQNFVKVKYGVNEILYDNAKGGYPLGNLTADTVIQVTTAADAITSYPQNPHDASFKPTIEYKTAAGDAGYKSSTIAAQIQQSVIEPNLSLTIEANPLTLTNTNDKSTIKLKISNSAGKSTAYDPMLEFTVTSGVYFLTDIDAISGLSHHLDGNGNTIFNWAVDQGGISSVSNVSRELSLDIRAHDTTLVNSVLNVVYANLTYYSRPDAPDRTRKVYGPLQGNDVGVTVRGKINLTANEADSLTAGSRLAVFEHVLKNNGAGKDTFMISANSPYPAALYLNNIQIASGYLDEGNWIWDFVDPVYKTTFGGKQVPGVPLNAGATAALKLEVTVSENVPYKNVDEPFEIKATSKLNNAVNSAVQNKIKVTGPTLDGWSGVYTLANKTPGNTWTKPSYRPGDTLVLQAISAVHINSVKASYYKGVNGAIIATLDMELANPNSYKTDGYKLWKLPTPAPTVLTIAEAGTYNVTFVGYVNSVEVERDEVAGEAGANNPIEVIEPILNLLVTAEKTTFSQYGETGLFTIKVSNTGTSEAHDVQIPVTIANMAEIMEITPSVGVTNVTSTGFTWTLDSLEKLTSKTLTFKVKALTTTDVNAVIDVNTGLVHYYSLANGSGKIYEPALTDSKDITVLGSHTLTPNREIHLTAGKAASFMTANAGKVNTLQNTGAGMDTYLIDVSGPYPADLYADDILIASGSRSGGLWSWNHIEDDYAVSGSPAIKLAANESKALGMVVHVPVSVPNGTIENYSIKSTSVRNNIIKTVTDTVYVDGIVLDGWSGSYDKEHRNAEDSNGWKLTSYRHGDEIELNAVSSVHIEGVKAVYWKAAGVPSEPIELSVANATYVQDGYKLWKASYLLPFGTPPGDYKVNFTGSYNGDPAAQMDNSAETGIGANNPFEVIESDVQIELGLSIGELSITGDKSTATLTVVNDGTSIAHNVRLEVKVTDTANITNIVPGAGVSVISSTYFLWDIDQLAKDNDKSLTFDISALNTTSVSSNVYVDAKVIYYYSLPNKAGKSYGPGQPVRQTINILGSHTLVDNQSIEVKAGQDASFTAGVVNKSHTLHNIGAGSDQYLITVDGPYPADLYAGDVLIASGNKIGGHWNWTSIAPDYKSDNSAALRLNAGASKTLGLVVHVPETVANGTEVDYTINATSVNNHSTKTVRDTISVVGTALDGWSGNQTRTNWSIPIQGHDDSLFFNAVSASYISVVKATYTDGTSTGEVTLDLMNGGTNKTYLADGMKKWYAVGKLPRNVAEAVYSVTFTGYDVNNEPVEIDSMVAPNNQNGANNPFKTYAKVNVKGTITNSDPAAIPSAIEDAKVTLINTLTNKPFGDTVRTDANGHYFFGNVPVDPYKIVVEKNLFTETIVDFYALPADPHLTDVIVDAKITQFHISLIANPTSILGNGTSTTELTAFVTKADGTPIAGVLAEFNAPRGTFSNNAHTATALTGQDGKARITYTSELIIGIASERIPVVVKVDDEPRGLYATAQIVISFDPGAITGVVTEMVNGVSKPVANAEVVVTRDFDGDGIIDFTARALTKATDPDKGSYFIAIPASGEYIVKITKPVQIGNHIENVTFVQTAVAGALTDASSAAPYEAVQTASGVLFTKDSHDGGATHYPDTMYRKMTGHLVDSVGNDVTLPFAINDDGTFNVPNVTNGSYRLIVMMDLGNGEEIAINNSSSGQYPIVNISSNGEMNIVVPELIDPYGIVRDAVTHLPIPGATVTLYYADGPQNVGVPAHAKDTPVSLPLIPGFLPNDNGSPNQTTDANGNYAYMVYPHTDYYLVVTAPGYHTYRSPLIQVFTAIVEHHPLLQPITSSGGVVGGGGAVVGGNTEVLPDTGKEPDLKLADLAVDILSDRAAYPEDGIVTFTIHYLNKSNVTVKGAAVTAQIPQYTDIFFAAGGIATLSNITWTLGDLAPKAAGTIIYKVKVKANSLPQAEVKVTNEAVITAADALINLEDDKSPLSILLFTSRFGDQGHDRYIKGYPDGNFKPNRAITRAEIAAIFSRIMNLQSTVTGEQFYKDITPTFWAKEYIETATRVGLFTGYENGDFRPDAPITRAELSTVIFRYLKLTDRAPIKLDFTDIETHWAKNAIEEIYRYHIITGYPDKTFRPGADMIRTEAVTMINRLLNRGPLYGAEVSFPDVNASHWAFGQVEESAITHEYKRYEDGSEQMTKYIPEPLW